MPFQRKRTLKLTHVPMPKWLQPIQVSLDDDTLHDENKQVVNEGNADSPVYCENDYERPTTKQLKKNTNTIVILLLQGVWMN